MFTLFYVLGSLLLLSIFVEVCQVLLKISSGLCNASCLRLTIISLVIASGPGDFFDFKVTVMQGCQLHGVLAKIGLFSGEKT